MKVGRRGVIGGMAGSLVPQIGFAKRVGTMAGGGSPPATPVAINFSPPSPVSQLDTSLSGALVTAITVTMSDSSTFTGTLAFAAPYFDASGLVAFSGHTLVLTRTLGGADDGAHLITISATENSSTLPASLTMNVVAAGGVGTFAGGPNTVYQLTSYGNGPLQWPRMTPELSQGSGFTVSGTVRLGAYWGNNPTGAIVTGQYYIDNGIPLGPLITTDSTVGGFDNSRDWFVYSLDTTTLTDGSHVLYVNLVDSPNVDCYAYGVARGTPVVVSNGTLGTGPQNVFGTTFTVKGNPPMADRVFYTGVPNPVNATYPYVYRFCSPASARGGDPARYRDSATYVAVESITSPRDTEYDGPPQFSTTTAGGVCITYLNPLQDQQTNLGAYNVAIAQNAMYGTRLNNQISNLSTFLEAPTWLAGGGCWLGVSVDGRFFHIDNAGNTTNLAGWERDRSVLTLDPFGVTSEATSTRLSVGTFPTDVDLGGATDLVSDPRDTSNHTFFILSQLDNYVAKVVLTGTSIAAGVTAVVTVYAGLPGATDAYVEAAGTGATNARFAQPQSLQIADTTLPNGDPIGTIYIADTANNAIRRITADGLTVNTMYGGSLAPTAPSSSASVGFFTTVITSLTWSATGGGQAVLVSASPVTGVYGVGCSVGFSGATNTFGTKNINQNQPGFGKWAIIAFTNNQHFTLAMPGGSPDFGAGAFGGTITAYSFAIDTYSPPGTVPLLTGSLGYVYKPGFIRFNSTHHLSLSEQWSLIVRDIDLAANTIRRIGSYADVFDNTDPMNTPGSWMMHDVDAAGVLGPVDDIMLANMVIASHYFWRLSWDGTYTAEDYTDFGVFASIGQNSTTTQGAGHYQWAWSFSRREGRAIATGEAQHPPAMIRIQESDDLTVNVLGNVGVSYNNFLNGMSMWLQGSCIPFPWTLRPSFTSLWGWEGDGHVLGYTWDDLMHNTALGNFASTTPGDAGDVALAAYINAGMGGVVPRPEITGNDMRDLIYFIRRNTMQGSGLPQLGLPLVVIGADDPDTTTPHFLTLSAVRASPTSITVSWTTDKSTIGLAMAGSASQQSVAVWPLPIASPPETSYGTSHTVTITGIPVGVTPVYYCAIAKDHPGHCTYSSTQTVT